MLLIVNVDGLIAVEKVTSSDGTMMLRGDCVTACKAVIVGAVVSIVQDP